MVRRNHRYLFNQKDDRAFARYVASFNDPDCRPRNLVEKLRIKKGGKFRDQQLSHEAWCEEMRDICPNG